MHSLKVLLLLITKGFPPIEGAHHAALVTGGKLTLVIHIDGGFLHISLEDEDLERPPGDIYADVVALIAAHRADPKETKRRLDA